MNDALSITQLGLSVAAGSLTTLSPCVFPLLPLVAGGVAQSRQLGPVAMGVGMAASFAAIGLLLGAAGSSIGIDPGTVRVMGGALLVLFAAVMLVPRLNVAFTKWMSPISSGADVVAARVDRDSLIGAFMLGGLLGIVWSPCSGPLLASALTLVATEGGIARGGLVLGAFGIGAAIPLVAVAYASRAGFMRMKGKVLGRIEIFKKGFALVIGSTGISIVLGWDKWFEALVTSRLPDWWVNLASLL